MFQRGNQKDFLMKVLNLLLDLIIVLLLTLNQKFLRNCLKQDKVRFTYKQVVNIWIACEVSLWLCNIDKDFPLRNSLILSVKLTKNGYPDKYKSPAYGIGFEALGRFSLLEGSRFGKNLVIFGAGMISLMHFDNKKKTSLVLVKVQQMV